MSESDVKAIFQNLNAACQGQLNLSSLAQRLQSLHAFDTVGRANPVGRYSQSIVDSLPKLFRSATDPQSVSEQLQQKLNSHSLLLQMLSDGGIMLKLHPSTLRCLFEDGQKTRALMEIRVLDSSTGETQGSSLASVVHKAGEQCCSSVRIGGEKPADDVYFYSVPTATAVAFLQQMSQAFATISSHVLGNGQKLRVASELVNGLLSALEAAQEQRSYQQQYHSTAFTTAIAGLDEPEWTASAEVRGTLNAAATALIKLISVLREVEPDMHLQAIDMMFAVTERLLNAFAAALAAVRSDQRHSLHEEYASVRDNCLNSLLAQAFGMMQLGSVHGDEYLQKVESLAESHNGYRQLFDICDFLSDRARLQAHMARLTGNDLTESMTIYVFTRLLVEQRQSELLTLDDDCNLALAHWLRERSPAADKVKLRWLHDVRQEKFDAAAESLAELIDHTSQSDTNLYYLEALQKLSGFAASSTWPFDVSGS